MQPLQPFLVYLERSFAAKVKHLRTFENAILKGFVNQTLVKQKKKNTSSCFNFQVFPKFIVQTK